MDPFYPGYALDWGFAIFGEAVCKLLETQGRRLPETTLCPSRVCAARVAGLRTGLSSGEPGLVIPEPTLQLSPQLPPGSDRG